MKKFTFLLVALFVAAMGFAQKEASVNFKKGTLQLKKATQQLNYNTRNTRAVIFSENFEGDGLPTGWTTIDADGDGYCWETLATTNAAFAEGYGHESDGAIASWSYYPTSQSSSGWSGTSLNTNDYLVTPQITIPAGGAKLTFFAASLNTQSYPDDLEVKISTTGTNQADFTTVLIAKQTITSSYASYAEMTASLNAYAGQQVYIAFIHESEDKFGLFIDDVSIVEVTPYDIAVTAVEFSENTGCGLTTTDAVVTVMNNGTENITSFTLSYTINEGTPVETTVTPAEAIVSGETYEYTIEGLDISTEGTYTMAVTATLENDGNTADNSKTAAIAHIAPSTVPYNNTFDTDEELAGCSIINANNDAVAWGIYTLDEDTGDLVPAILSGNAENGNNDYFVTSCITMTAGTYRMTVDIQGGGQEIDWNTFSYVTYYDDLSIVFGTAPTAEALTNHIYDSTGYYGQETLVRDFVIAEAGTYYFGFKVSSANGYQSFINNLNIQEVLAHDVTILDVDFVNATGCGLTSNNVIVTVRNDGTDPITSFGLAYSVNEGTPVEVTVTPAEAIVKDSTYTYTFEQEITVDADGDYDVVVTATLEGDTNTDGNEAEASFGRLAPETMPYTLVFDDEETLYGWTIIDANEDGTTWQYSDGAGLKYNYNSTNEANDWAISSCITIPAGAYKFSFRHTSSSSYPENLKVFYGNAPTIEAMTNMIEDYPSITGAAVDSKNFTIADDGIYYLGFYCYSEANMYYLNIDSIHIEAIPPYEASVSNLTFGTPSGCGIESSTISATITNNGSAPLTTFTAAYKVEDNEPVSQEFTLENALALDSSYVFTFETPMAIAEVGEYDVTVYITYEGDENHDNDTIAGTIEKMVPEIALTAMAFADGATLPYEETMNIAGTITNTSCALTSYVVTYKVNDGEFVADYTVECNVAEGETHNFTHNVPFTPEATGDYTITVKVSMPNGVEDIATDNEMTATITLINCESITSFPFEERFEDGVPACWTTIDNDNDGHNWMSTADMISLWEEPEEITYFTHSGNGSVASESYINHRYGALTPENYLITPAIVLPNDGIYGLSFYVANTYAYEENLTVKISTTGNDVDDFTVTAIPEETIDVDLNSGEWAEKTYSLADFAGQTIYIAIIHTGEDGVALLVDDFSIALGNEAEENLVEAIAVYPNPTSDMVTIANAEGKDILVINSLGQVVASIENAAANQTIDVSNFANGTYFVKVDGEVIKLNVVK